MDWTQILTIQIAATLFGVVCIGWGLRSALLKNIETPMNNLKADVDSMKVDISTLVDAISAANDAHLRALQASDDLHQKDHERISKNITEVMRGMGKALVATVQLSGTVDDKTLAALRAGLDLHEGG